MLSRVGQGELITLLEGLGIDLSQNPDLSFEDILNMLLGDSNTDAGLDMEPADDKTQQGELIALLGGNVSPDILRALGEAQAITADGQETKGGERGQESMEEAVPVPIGKGNLRIPKDADYIAPQGDENQDASPELEKAVQGDKEPDREQQAKVENPETRELTVKDDTTGTKAGLQESVSGRSKVRVGKPDTTPKESLAPQNSPERNKEEPDLQSLSPEDTTEEVKLPKEQVSMRPDREPKVERRETTSGDSGKVSPEPLEIEKAPRKNDVEPHHPGEEPPVSQDRPRTERSQFRTGNENGSEVRRDSTAVFHNVGEQARSEEQETAQVYRREQPQSPPSRAETRQVTIRFEDTHLRFRFHNDSMNVEIRTAQDIQKQLSYLDVQRLSRNIESLGISLESLKVNGSELTGKGSRSGRRSERFNIREEDGADKKVLHSSSDSPDINLLL
ncbi:hypothetical protein [Hydrogenivirga sp.]